MDTLLFWDPDRRSETPISFYDGDLETSPPPGLKKNVTAMYIILRFYGNCNSY